MRRQLGGFKPLLKSLDEVDSIRVDKETSLLAGGDVADMLAVRSEDGGNGEQPLKS